MCVSVLIFAFLCVCVYKFLFARQFIRMCLCVCACVCIYMLMCVCVRACVCLVEQDSVALSFLFIGEEIVLYSSAYMKTDITTVKYSSLCLKYCFCFLIIYLSFGIYCFYSNAPLDFAATVSFAY